MTDYDSSMNGVNGSGTGETGEAASPGRCPTVGQGGPGRHPATARMKWSRDMNIAVMECYYLSKPVDESGRPVRGYRQRMHTVWKERGLQKITEQRLCDQARAIRKNEWFTSVELDEIKRRMTSVDEELEEQDVGCIDTEPEQVDELNGDVNVQIADNDTRNDEGTQMIKDILEIMRSGQVSNGAGFKRVDRNVLAEWTKKVNRVVSDIQTTNITDTNKLINASAIYIGRQIGLKVGGCEGKGNKEPRWKRRIRDSIADLRRHINILERSKQGKLKRKEKYTKLERKFNIKQKGEKVVIEELKQRLLAKSAKLKRYEQRIHRYKVNRLFQQDQKRVYQEMNGTSSSFSEVRPDAGESQQFWRNIWGKDVLYNVNAEWLKELKKERVEGRQENIVITAGMVTARSKKIPNWKAPGPDGVQGYWIKKLTTLHERMADHMNDLINNRVTIPVWMTTGRTVLCQKDQERGSAVDNYRPISCLPLVWKLMTGIIADSMYEFFVENDVLPVEQKGCRRKSRGTKDQLLIDKMVLADCKRKHKNLAMAWVDYKKAYDMVPHSWIIESLKMAQVAENIITFLQKSMVNWKTELTSCGETLGLVDIKRGIFQGDSLSPLIFTVCMVPLTKILQDAKAGYTLGDVKINHLFFMDDLKVYGKDKAEIESLVSTVQLISQDIGMEFGIKKCGVVVLKRGKLCKSEGIKLINGQTIKEVGDEGYKYLGILELDKFKEKEMKEIFRTEYLRRFKLVMKSQLNGKNKIKAANTWAVSLMRYGAGTIKWNKEELQDIDKKSRKIMTMNKELHPRSDVARIYVPRKKGGRGLISCECCIRREENNLSWYVRNSEEVLLRKVGDSNVVNISEAVDPNKYKVNEVEETENEWKQKRMHGQYVREKEGIDWDRTWQWIAKGDLKGCTEALICSAQEQALRTNYTRFHIDHTAESPLCRMCGCKGETVAHVVSECSKLAQTEYKGRHDNVARYIHWQLCGKYGLERANSWYEQKPEGVVESENFKILWDFTIQCDRKIEARRPDIVFIDKKKREVVMIDVAIPGDDRVKEKELEKIEKYQLLKDEIAKVWHMRKVIVVPVVIGALGAVSVNFKEYMKRIGVKVRLEVIQKTALLGTAKILRKVLSL